MSFSRPRRNRGIALFDPKWEGSHELQTHEGKYFLTYIGGRDYGYEKIPLHIGLASTEDPSKALPWGRESKPILMATDPGAREDETGTLYKSYIFKDETKTLGPPFVMFYNAKAARE